ncbi:MAG: hypothetical protein Q9184_003402 [Pyrenodesmia sp. 2 TL-2023]
MVSFTRLTALAALLASSVSQVAAVGISGSGTTTRYWDCCKPSCAWSRPGLTSPVKTCSINDQPLADGVTAQSGCNGGTSFMCSSQSPWAINDNLAYGFAAVSANNNPACCTCYKLTFTDTEIKGKTMIVQATNTGYDVSGAQFDLAMPGGGFGLFDGCSKQWKANSSIWGAQYGGSTTNQCAAYPPALQKGCGFRWDWMKGQSNPKYVRPYCPPSAPSSHYLSPTYSKPGTSKHTLTPPPHPQRQLRTSNYPANTTVRKRSTIPVIVTREAVVHQNDVVKGADTNVDRKG